MTKTIRVGLILACLQVRLPQLRDLRILSSYLWTTHTETRSAS